MTTAAMLMVEIRGGREPLRQRCNDRSFASRESLHWLTIQQLLVESETVREWQSSLHRIALVLSFSSYHFKKMIWSNYCNCVQFLEEEQPFFFLLSIKRRENGFESDVKLSLEAALCFLATAEKLLGSANCNGCLMHRYF